MKYFIYHHNIYSFLGLQNIYLHVATLHQLDVVHCMNNIKNLILIFNN
jgi:hypothetical protein